MSKKNRPQLGQWCAIDSEIFKVRKSENLTGYPVQTIWKPKEYGYTIRGMYIGWRIVKTGKTNSDLEFIPNEYFEVWLFVVTDNRNPIRVLPDKVIWKGQS